MRNYKSLVLIYPLIFLLSFIVLCNEPAVAQKHPEPSIMIEDFYPVQRGVLERAWAQVAGVNGANIPHIRKAAKKYNMHPADVATVLVADSACRFAWPGGLPNEIPFGFVHSQTGISQIPPSMAASHRLIESGLLISGAKSRFKRMRESTLQPEKGVDYWFKSLVDESYEAMKDPGVNIRVAARFMRRVSNAALNLYKPDARDSLMMDDQSLIPKQHIRWADEFDWGKLKKYLRDHILWDYTYEFDITEFAPSDDRISELNMMILYSEYRTSPPFDGSWFFEAMYLVRETRRWLNSREDILDQLKPLDGKVKPYVEWIEDYSFYQNEAEMLNPGRVRTEDEDSGNTNDKEEKKDEKSKSEDKGKRKTRGGY